jgi:hypothetical protein
MLSDIIFLCHSTSRQIAFFPSKVNAIVSYLLAWLEPTQVEHLLLLHSKVFTFLPPADISTKFEGEKILNLIDPQSLFKKLVNVNINFAS